MIIGISGKKQSGKDTVAKIIQYLTLSDYSSVRTNQLTFEKCTNIDLVQSNWQIVKFADKLKDIVCIIIGCTREQLEDEEFKNTPLSKEYNLYELHLTSNLNRGNKSDNIFPSYEVANEYRNSKSSYRHRSKIITRELTPRMLLQQIGTDVCRNIHPNMWVNATMRDYQITAEPEIIVSTGDVDERCGKFPSYPNWIITDVRFPNEYDAIKQRGGIIIRVNRFSKTQKVRVKARRGGYINPDGPTDQHPSETSLDNHEFDYVIDNNGTIDDLIVKVKDILIKEKLI